MRIQQSVAVQVPDSDLSAKRQKYAEIAQRFTDKMEKKTAETTAISQEARDRLLSETATESSARVYRLEGPVYSFEDVMKKTGLPLIAVKMTDDQLNEIKLREQQENAREIVNANYAKANQDKPVGQVVVNGKLVATVFDRGVLEMPHAIANLSDKPLSPPDRLAEIAHLTKGEIIYSNFLPTMGGWSGPGAPESMLPPITARSEQEIFLQDILPAREKLIKEWEEQTGRQYPR